MPSITTWKKLNAASGLAFGVFLLMHFFCHASLSISWELAQANLLKARAIYRHPVFELALFAALAIHTVSNGVLYNARQRIEGAVHAKTHEQPGAVELKAHRTAGIILGVSIGSHVMATRVVPLLVMEDSSLYDYSFLAAANDRLPSNFFALFLLVFAMAGVWHGIYGARSAISTLTGHSVHAKPFPTPLKFLSSLSHLALMSAAASLTGYYYVIDTETKAELHEHYFSTVENLFKSLVGM